MNRESPDEPKPAATQGAFLTTRWSVVLRAGKDDSHEALAQLCRDYWYPLYAFVRRRGRSMEDAQDVTQAFFCKSSRAKC